MDNSKNRYNDNLGVNKMGKNIRKSPLHQPNYGNNVNGGKQQQQPQPQPQVYNISKNEFRDIVQQLTGSPSQDPQSKPPQNNSPKPQNMRLQKIKPPPLPYVRPPLPAPYNNNTLATRPAQFRQPSPIPFPQANTAESPISAYMRYLEHSLTDPGSKGSQVQPQLPSALFPNHLMLPSQRLNGPLVSVNGTNPLPPPHVPGVPSPQTNGPPIVPSPTSQFFLPSPNGYMNFLSPQSAYPSLLSPGIQFPSPFTPNFPFSPFGQSGILGPGQQPPLSPGMLPLSPSGFFPITSPRW
ncbi:unnamed protein product [Sphenostylis stenocarpa]|uniref:VQ domain-containing protein n=1 Tax=Sphenostylis stenocarpa TaxID=92480 RepID=A0AA86V7Y8_9FABA|nr:unnamed protein product [Sphenostylis stenocarpa]